MSDCKSLQALLAAIDQAIAEYDYKQNPRYMDSLRKQADWYWREAERLNKATDELIKQRIKNNGGYTRGVRG
ncbi:hypothetical protein [Pseudanabaena sp. 'Roaring Creek']|uniref:hypothetical protein n=1 Tax=Pseudanabaena sp. 'Roaring Creek' TaxID=1681830 RepID=UPI0006D78117|nr:hypothetical protein [Pseudanabaena sp. 'Roaring Creek']